VKLYTAFSILIFYFKASSKMLFPALWFILLLPPLTLASCQVISLRQENPYHTVTPFDPSASYDLNFKSVFQSPPPFTGPGTDNSHVLQPGQENPYLVSPGLENVQGPITLYRQPAGPNMPTRAVLNTFELFPNSFASSISKEYFPTFMNASAAVQFQSQSDVNSRLAGSVIIVQTGYVDNLARLCLPSYIRIKTDLVFLL
jgi:hypothetical protein